MKKTVFVRPAKPDDVHKFSQWSVDTKNNGLDPAVVGYPTTSVLCAYDADGPLVYMPVQQPFFLESLAIRPEASPAEVSSALKALVQASITQAHLRGVGEVYFLATHEGTAAFAGSRIFEEVPHRLFRVKISDLEGRPDENLH